MTNLSQLFFDSEMGVVDDVFCIPFLSGAQVSKDQTWLLRSNQWEAPGKDKSWHLPGVVPF